MVQEQQWSLSMRSIIQEFATSAGGPAFRYTRITRIEFQKSSTELIN